jgi:hypothetical protein
MKINAELDEDSIEFHPGYTKYSVDIDVPNQEGQTIIVKREIIHGSFTSEDKVHPVLLKVAINCVKDYIAKIYTQSNY